MAWGQGTEVWVAQRGRYDPAFCSDQSGVFLSRSTNGGATFAAGDLAAAREQDAPSRANNPAFTFRNLDLVFEPGERTRPSSSPTSLTYGAADCTGRGHRAAASCVASPWQPGDAAPATR